MSTMPTHRDVPTPASADERLQLLHVGRKRRLLRAVRAGTTAL